MTRREIYGCSSYWRNFIRKIASFNSLRKSLVIIPLVSGLFYPSFVANPHPVDVSAYSNKSAIEEKAGKNLDNYFLTEGLKSEIRGTIENLVSSEGSRKELENVLSVLSAYDKFFLEASRDQNFDVSFIKACTAQESRGNLYAESDCGATGLGGLMEGTAKELGLIVNNLVDERVDPKATMNSAAYMKKSIDRFGTILGLVAYNRGPTWVSNNLVRILNEPEILKNKMIVLESRKYIVEVLARAVIFSNPSDYGLEFENKKPILRDLYLEHTTKKEVSLKNLASIYRVKLDDLKQANPAIKSGKVPEGVNIYIPPSS